ncbi:MAG: CPBP family intramembrane metalloprotease [Candidatus Eremiobacteraeota bacterium]|nr:CPBP family intramembrane metalloprotease [Candidatus Eremiobacteraeota bacterium]
MTRIAFGALAILSLGLLSIVDDNVYAFASAHAPGLEWIARYRLTSLAVSLALYVTTGPALSYRLPARDAHWRAVAVIAAFWFVPDLLMLYVARVPVPVLQSVPDFTAFLVTGLLAEELLFRGAIYQLAERALPRTFVIAGTRLPLWPIVVSALLFSLAHFQYYGFAITPRALAQVSYTLIMGLMWGPLRSVTSSIWPAIAFHLLTNAIALPRIIGG